jgi:Protein of unknown function (DUF2785)
MRLKWRIHCFLSLLLSVGAAESSASQAPCPPNGYDRARIEALKAADWAVVSDKERNALAKMMTACVASTDPRLREMAYEALQRWMRAGALESNIVLAIGNDLQARLSAPDGSGVERPFAALVLAEVARTDRVKPWLTPLRRASLLDASIDYLTHIHDYRGFDDREGWRHGIAHGADLMLQLVLNPVFGKQELTRIRDAVATQISPPSHFYIYGEGERLAAPIVYMAQRKLFSETEWTAWLGLVVTPSPLASWRDAYSSNANIARVHNVKAFVQAVFLNTSLNNNIDDDVLAQAARVALTTLP